MTNRPGLVPVYEGSTRLAVPRLRVGRNRRPVGPLRIDAELLNEVLGRFGLEPTGSARDVQKASRADNVVVDTDAGPKLLKRYKPAVTAEMIEHEHEVLAHLANQGFPSPRLVATPMGATAVELAGRWYAIFDYHAGGFHYNDYLWMPRPHRDLVELSGRSLGALHLALAGFVPRRSHPQGFQSPAGPRYRPADWYLAELDEARRRASDDSTGGADRLRAMLQEHASTVEQQLIRLDAELEAAQLPRQVVHGDYGPYNLLLRAGHEVIVLDFELSRLDWRVVDLAKAIPQFASPRIGFRRRRTATFLAGYRDQVDLDEAELRWIGPTYAYLTLRRVIVCWARCARTDEQRWLDEATKRLARLGAIPEPLLESQTWA